MDRKIFKNIIIVMILICALFTSACSSKDKDTDITEVTEIEETLEVKEEVKEEGDEPAEEKVQQFVYVHVCGAVKNPGVYKLSNDSRVYEAVMAAGGPREDGCPDLINQARPVSDGEQIYVPDSEDSLSESLVQGTEGISSDGIVNINTASKDELMTLPGIGNSKAESIVSYRETNGSFTDINDLKNVEGIKDGVFNKVKDKISI